MDLACQQTALFSLLRSGHADEEPTDPYIREVAASAHLTMLREIVLAWRLYDIRRHCRLTASLLHKLGNLEEAVKSFAATPSLSPFPDQLAEAFLRQMSEHSDPIIASTAKFELYLAKVRRGDSGEYMVDWPTDPTVLLTNLTREGALPSFTTNGHYQTRISRQYPGWVRITSQLHGKPLGSDVEVVADRVRRHQINHKSDHAMRQPEEV